MLKIGIVVSDCHRLNLASEQVGLYRFDADSPTRRLIKSIVLEEVQLVDGMASKQLEASSKRENDWIIAAAKETMSEFKDGPSPDFSVAQIPLSRFTVFPG